MHPPSRWLLAGTPEEVLYMGDVPDSATGRLGQILPGLLAQGGTLGRRSREPVFSIGGFDIIVSGVIDTTRFADGLSTVGFFAYRCPGVARFRALGQGRGL